VVIPLSKSVAPIIDAYQVVVVVVAIQMEQGSAIRSVDAVVVARVRTMSIPCLEVSTAVLLAQEQMERASQVV
jgi:hypothetical protein